MCKFMRGCVRTIFLGILRKNDARFPQSIETDGVSLFPHPQKFERDPCSDKSLHFLLQLKIKDVDLLRPYLFSLLVKSGTYSWGIKGFDKLP